MTLPVLAAAGLLAGIALLSLGWRIEHDTPTMAYAGFLFGHLHFVPYRDLFDPNMPGTYAVFTVLDLVFGPHDLGFRIADVVLLALLCYITWRWLRPFGWLPATLAPALFGLYYLHDGPTLCLQREYLMLPLFSAAVLLTTGAARLPPALRAAAVGFSVGLAALIKPQAMIVLPSLLAYLVIEAVAPADTSQATPETPAAEPHALPVAARRTRGLAIAASGIAAAALPVLAVIAVMAMTGALPYYLEMARHYYPLYAHLSGIHETMSDAERARYLRLGLWLGGGLRWWLVPAALGTYVTAGPGAEPWQRRRVILFVALAATTYVFPAIAGQFFPYHWIPFFFFVAVLSSLALARPAQRVPAAARRVAVVALVVVAVTNVKIAEEIKDQIAGTPIHPHFRDRVDPIAYYLKLHLGPGDTVQPLDWTGGAVDAMWRARAPLATRFMADFYFYHHISTPYIQSLRRQFIAELARARPRVVIEILTAKPWVSGHDTTREFPELQRWLDTNYVADAAGPGFVLHLRKD